MITELHRHLDWKKMIQICSYFNLSYSEADGRVTVKPGYVSIQMLSKYSFLPRIFKPVKGTHLENVYAPFSKLICSSMFTTAVKHTINHIFKLQSIIYILHVTCQKFSNLVG